MNYSKGILGEELENLSWKEVENFFSSNQEENELLEFKSYHTNGTLESKLETICRTVSAFLNSNGGLLIWGAPKGERVDGRKEKRFIGPLTPISEMLEKDTLVRIISSKIHPFPNGVRLRIIEKENSRICIFEIDKSNSAHQFMGTYYMRIDGQTVPAPHHFVEALIKQIRFPDLGGYLHFRGFIFQSNRYKLALSVKIFNWSPLQNEKTVSFRLITTKGKFRGWDYQPIAHNYQSNGMQLINHSLTSVLHYGMPVNENCDILFDQSEFSNDNTLVLVLHFGGELSPIRQSKYVLKLRPLNNGESVNSLVESIEENILYSTFHQDKSKEDILKGMLGR